MPQDSGDRNLHKRLARAAALLRLRGYTVIEPPAAVPAHRLVYGPLVLDMKASTLTFRSNTMGLTPFRLILLRSLMEAEGAWCSRRALRKLLWGKHVPSSDSLAVHMHALREQLLKFTGSDVIESTRLRGFRMAFERLDQHDEPAAADG